MAQLVGILNITPDSFSDGGLFVEPTAALRQLRQLFDAGASMVDIGAESTRPGAAALTPSEEWKRLSPVLAAALGQYPDRISLDTFHPETVSRAVEAFGPYFIVNDVTAFANRDMIDVTASCKLRCIISHLPHQAHGDIQAAHKGTLLDDEQVVKRELL